MSEDNTTNSEILDYYFTGKAKNLKRLYAHYAPDLIRRKEYTNQEAERHLGIGRMTKSRLINNNYEEIGKKTLQTDLIPKLLSYRHEGHIEDPIHIMVMMAFIDKEFEQIVRLEDLVKANDEGGDRKKLKELKLKKLSDITHNHIRVSSSMISVYLLMMGSVKESFLQKYNNGYETDNYILDLVRNRIVEYSPKNKKYNLLIEDIDENDIEALGSDVVQSTLFDDIKNKFFTYGNYRGSHKRTKYFVEEVLLDDAIRLTKDYKSNPEEIFSEMEKSKDRARKLRENGHEEETVLLCANINIAPIGDPIPLRDNEKDLEERDMPLFSDDKIQVEAENYQ